MILWGNPALSIYHYCSTELLQPPPLLPHKSDTLWNSKTVSLYIKGSLVGLQFSHNCGKDKRLSQVFTLPYFSFFNKSDMLCSEDRSFRAKIKKSDANFIILSLVENPVGANATVFFQFQKVSKLFEQFIIVLFFRLIWKITQWCNGVPYFSITLLICLKWLLYVN